MKVMVQIGIPNTQKAAGLIMGVFADKKFDASLSKVDKAVGRYFSSAQKKGLFEGKPGQVISVATLGAIAAERVTIVGLGPQADATEEVLRRAAAVGIKSMRAAGIESVATTLHGSAIKKVSAERKAEAVTEGALLALYRFEWFKSEKSKKKVKSLTLLATDATQKNLISRGLRVGKALAESALFARDLINAPGNHATPTFLANEAKKFSRSLGVKAHVLNPAQIEKLKMGGLMAVAQGSAQPARFIILEWMKGPASQKPIVIVGKGLTFDTGGISIKPSAGMEDMKMDMSGGAAALGVMRAAATLKLKVNLVVLVPTTENMPSSTAIKPGDVVTGLSGVTMEILNTDAEGRLILADALAYAARYKPDCIIDMATLTGSCMVALGQAATGLFTRNEKMRDQLVAAGEETGERCWPLPLLSEHEEEIKSDIADIKNIGSRYAGASTAAAFLLAHVTTENWAHLDIAGTAYTTKAAHYQSKGAVGVGVRHIIRFIEARTAK